MARSSVFACFLCPRTDEILLVHQKGGKWSLPGGRRSASEHAMGALRRELNEETHYTLPPNARPEKAWRILRPWRKGQRQAIVYLFRHRPEVRARSEIDRVHWFPIAALPEDISRTVSATVCECLRRTRMPAAHPAA